jgi:hypothetical protein
MPSAMLALFFGRSVEAAQCLREGRRYFSVEHLTFPKLEKSEEHKSKK